MSAATSHPQSRPDRATSPDLAAAALLAVAGPALLAASTSLSRSAPTTPEAAVLRLLALLAGIAGLLLLAWWAVGLLGLVLQAAGRRTGRTGWERVGLRLTPRMLQRVGAAVLGAHLIAAPAALADTGPLRHGPIDASWSAAAAATPVDAADRAGAHRPPSAAWTPRSPQTPPPGAAPTGRPTAERPTVTVRSGDCLWDIAARELGPDATPREVDRRWRDWHRENADAIGPDPHLLLPGTVLTAPVFSPHDVPDSGPTAP